MEGCLGEFALKPQERIVYSNGAEKTGKCGEQQKLDWGGKKSSAH